jgi:hypothetical protein
LIERIDNVDLRQFLHEPDEKIVVTRRELVRLCLKAENALDSGDKYDALYEVRAGVGIPGRSQTVCESEKQNGIKTLVRWPIEQSRGFRFMKKTALWFAVVGFFVGFAFVTYYAGNAFNPKSPGAFFHILGGLFFSLFGLFVGWALGEGDDQKPKP